MFRTERWTFWVHVVDVPMDRRSGASFDFARKMLVLLGSPAMPPSPSTINNTHFFNKSRFGGPVNRRKAYSFGRPNWKSWENPSWNPERLVTRWLQFSHGNARNGSTPKQWNSHFLNRLFIWTTEIFSLSKNRLLNGPPCILGLRVRALGS